MTPHDIITSVEAALDGDAVRAVLTPIGGRVYDRLFTPIGLRLQAGPRAVQVSDTIDAKRTELAQATEELNEVEVKRAQAERICASIWSLLRGRHVSWMEKTRTYEGLVIHAAPPGDSWRTGGWLDIEHQTRLGRGVYKDQGGVDRHGIAVLVNRTGVRGQPLQPHVHWPKPEKLTVVS